MHMKGASGCRLTVMHNPGAQHPGQMFLTDSRFLESEENRGIRTKPSSQVEIDLNSTHVHRRGGRRKCTIQCQPDFPRHKARGHKLRMVAYKDINPAQQELNSVNKGNRFLPFDKPCNEDE